MLITVRLEPLLRAKSQLPTAKSKGSDPPGAKVLVDLGPWGLTKISSSTIIAFKIYCLLINKNRR